MSGPLSGFQYFVNVRQPPLSDLFNNARLPANMMVTPESNNDLARSPASR